MQLDFSPIIKEDITVVLQLLKEAALRIAAMNINHWQYWKNPPIEKVRWIEQGIQHGEFFFVKDEKVSLVGMVRILEEDLLYWGPQSEKALYVHSLVVRGAYEGMGIGQQILTVIGHKALLEQRFYLRLDAAANNPKLCAYYEKQGFHNVAVKDLAGSTHHLYQKKLH